MTYEAPDGLAIAIGAFDRPEKIEPMVQFGVEGRIAYLDHINQWSCLRTEEDIEDAPFLYEIISYQYNDEE